MKKLTRRKKIELIFTGVMVLLFIFAIFIGQPGRLRSYISMYPAIDRGDILYINKTAYYLKSPERGDITLSVEHTGEKREMPKDSFTKLIHPIYWSKVYKSIAIAPFGPLKPTNIKRIIGLPNETIELIDKQVYIDGEIYAYGTEIYIDESIFNPEWDYEERVNFPALKIPEKHYFIMGDHRDISRDSRTFGLVNEKDIKGKISTKLLTYENGKKRFFVKIK